MLNRSELFLLIGLPGSGKSTLARQLITACPQAILVSTDAIRAQLFGDESIQGNWMLIWQQIRQQFQQAVHQTPATIYDATNARRCYRREIIQLAQEVGFVKITALWVNTPLHICLERNRQRDRQVPEEVILQMQCYLLDTPPSLAEGLDQVIVLYGNCDRTSEKEPNLTL